MGYGMGGAKLVRKDPDKFADLKDTESNGIAKYGIGFKERVVISKVRNCHLYLFAV